MTFLNDLATGLRAKLRTAGLTVVPTTAAASDHTVTLSVRLLNGSGDVDGDNGVRDSLIGPCDVAVTVVERASKAGDADWLGATSETVLATLGTIRNLTVNGVPVAWVLYEYGADLGADQGRPEQSENFMVRASRPALV